MSQMVCELYGLRCRGNSENCLESRFEGRQSIAHFAPRERHVRASLAYRTSIPVRTLPDIPIRKCNFITHLHPLHPREAFFVVILSKTCLPSEWDFHQSTLVTGIVKCVRFKLSSPIFRWCSAFSNSNKPSHVSSVLWPHDFRRYLMCSDCSNIESEYYFVSFVDIFAPFLFLFRFF